MTGRITLSTMVFYAYHGDLPEEKTLGQRFSIDVVLTLDIAAAAATDDLNKTVDYTQVYRICRETVENDRFKLIETLACNVIDRILAACPIVDQVDIVIKKPSVPIAGILDHVSVETSKSRADRLPRTGQ
jgi:7,8-dihydroneopterin aldolase/epimerase/oxygenase